jgi:Xaa-Pro dipeptidase
MALHFSEAELAERRRKVSEALAQDGLHALLIFRQESMYYLTGFDTFGYVFFQCLYLGADGTLTLLTRTPDLRQAQHTSMVPDIRIWGDKAGATPAIELRAILAEHGAEGKRLGVELEAYGLTGRSWEMVRTALDGFSELVDASHLVSRERVVKSPSEIDYVRRAAELADDAYDAAVANVTAGAFEGDILAAMQGAVFRGGGDYPGNEFVIGSGDDALLCRYFSGRRHLDGQDQITLEWAGVYRRYHAAMMRTFIVGEADARHRALFAASYEALHATEEAIRPGEPIGKAFDAHARVMDAHGMEPHRMKACGYSLGTTFAPNWMDWPMLYTGNPVIVAPDMVFFLHMILADSDAHRAMTLGHTVRVTDTGIERLSRAPLDLVVVR